MTHSSEAGRSGIFRLMIEDSGDGFDFSEKVYQNMETTQNKFSGRGIPLIHSLCHSLEYFESGNKVVAEIHWP
jgi:anti-sigma regulatory factor (Ser/Thr protein kinase)